MLLNLNAKATPQITLGAGRHTCTIKGISLCADRNGQAQLKFQLAQGDKEISNAVYHYCHTTESASRLAQLFSNILNTEVDLSKFDTDKLLGKEVTLVVSFGTTNQGMNNNLYPMIPTEKKESTSTTEEVF